MVVVVNDVGIGMAGMTPFWFGSMVVAFLSISVDLVQIVRALSALLALLLQHVLSLVQRLLPLMSWILLLVLS